MTAYMTLAGIRFDETPVITDRPDLGCVVIYPAVSAGSTQIQVSDSRTARAWALAFAQAADMLDAQHPKAPEPEPWLCTRCGGERTSPRPHGGICTDCTAWDRQDPAAVWDRPLPAGAQGSTS